MYVRFFVIAVLLVAPGLVARAQPPYELKIWNKIRLQDGEFHELAITKSGILIDGKVKVQKAFDDVWPISDTVDYWDYPDSFYKVSSTGHYWLFGTHMYQGICGMSNYAVVYVNPAGDVRVAESPAACMGDDPSEIRFDLKYWKGDCHPIWNLSGQLEFDAFTFRWSDLTKPKKKNTRRR